MGETIIIGHCEFVYSLVFAMWLTGFLFEEGSRDNRLVDSLCIERHVVCALHVIDLNLLVSLW